MKNLLLIACGLAVVSVGLLLVVTKRDTAPVSELVGEPANLSRGDLRNLTYVVAGTPVSLVGGVAKTIPVLEGEMITETRYFGNELSVDLNADGKEDKVVILTQTTGGTGTYFYAAPALATETGYEGGQAVFIGDRIAPQSTTLGENNLVVINYADRAPGEPFTTAPSVGRSLILRYDSADGQFGEVVKDFEGEADPATMSLTMETWEWIETSLNDGRTIKPAVPARFTLTFLTDDSFSIATDCNGGGGTYAATADTITFSDMFSTLMYCEGSQEDEYRQFLGDVSQYHFTTKGELVLGLKFDSGTMTFR